MLEHAERMRCAPGGSASRCARCAAELGMEWRRGRRHHPLCDGASQPRARATAGRRLWPDIYV